MTGEKGIIFTAEYVTKFIEMKDSLKLTCIEDIVIQCLQEMKSIRLQLMKDFHGIMNVIKLDTISWREDSTKLINAITLKLGGYQHIKGIRE